MSRKSGYRFSDKDMRHSNQSRARPDSNGTGRALARLPLRVARRFRLFGQVVPQTLAHLVRLFRRPGSKAFAALHAELSSLDLLAQERMRPRGAVEIGGEHVADVEREIEPDEIGLLHRPQHRHAGAEAALD